SGCRQPSHPGHRDTRVRRLPTAAVSDGEPVGRQAVDPGGTTHQPALAPLQGPVRPLLSDPHLPVPAGRSAAGAGDQPESCEGGAGAAAGAVPALPGPGRADWQDRYELMRAQQPALAAYPPFAEAMAGIGEFVNGIGAGPVDRTWLPAGRWVRHTRRTASPRRLPPPPTGPRRGPSPRR